MIESLYLIGGGGHCRSVIDVIESLGCYRIAGIIDMQDQLGQQVLDCKVVATDKDFARLNRDDCGFIVTIGQVGSPLARIRVFATLKELKASLPVVISPYAHVSRYSQLGEGTSVMHGATVNSASIIGVNCILNSHCLIEHDAVIGDHCHISTGAVVNGACRVGDRSFVGSNSVLAQNVSITSDVIIGAGTVVHRDISEPGTYVGNPCRKIK